MYLLCFVAKIHGIGYFCTLRLSYKMLFIDKQLLRVGHLEAPKQGCRRLQPIAHGALNIGYRYASKGYLKEPQLEGIILLNYLRVVLIIITMGDDYFFYGGLYRQKAE